MTGQIAEPDETVSARHEAAHAVVAVRLGLPLISVDIHLDPMEMPDGSTIMTAGFTALDQEITQHWRLSLLDPEAVERITAIATQLAAGCVAESLSGIDPISHLGQYGDLLYLADVARELGIGPGVLTVSAGLTWDRLLGRLSRREWRRPGSYSTKMVARHGIV